jgi:hypothetical protein
MMTDLKLIPPTVHSDEVERVRIVAAGIVSTFRQPIYWMQFRLFHQKEWKNVERLQLFRPIPESARPPVAGSL